MLDGCNDWPATVREKFEQEGYWRGETLFGLFQRSVAEFPDHIALVDEEGHHLTYQQLHDKARRFGTGMLKLGIQPGDRVILHLHNCIEYVVALLGLFSIQAIAVLALPAHRATEIRHLVSQSRAVAYIARDSDGETDFTVLADQLVADFDLKAVIIMGDSKSFVNFSSVEETSDSYVRPDPREVVFFLLSGGTTGSPKLIPRTNDDYSLNVRMCVAASALTPSSVQLIVLPMSHNGTMGCPGIMGTLASGGKAVLSTDPSPDHCFALIERDQVTVATLVPPLAALWVEAAEFQDFDISSLQLLQVGGAKLHPELARKIMPALHCQLQQWFGLGEGPLCHTRLDDPEDLIVESQGRPLTEADRLKVVDESNTEVPIGEIGQLLATGPTTFCGYYRSPTDNARLFSPDGFLMTGDLVRMLPGGNICVAGRIKDVINRAGEKVSAEEVENQLLAHPKVRDVALIAEPDTILGERSCVVVIPAVDDVSLAELRSFLTSRGVAEYKLPDRLVLRDIFPLTSVGKVSKADLRRQLTS